MAGAGILGLLGASSVALVARARDRQAGPDTLTITYDVAGCTSFSA